MRLILCLLLAGILTSCTFVCENGTEIAVSPEISVLSAENASEYSVPLFPLEEPPPETEPQEETTAPEIPSEEPRGPVVYLTFDDGPGKYTLPILETLAEYDVKATFFVVGMFADFYPSRVRAIDEAGHAIGCHSYSHEYREVYESGETLRAEIDKWEASVGAALGFIPGERLFRFPGGSNCTAIESFPPLYDALEKAGYRAFDWSCANNDLWTAGKPDEMEMPDYLKHSLMQSVAICGDNRIVLMHDTSAGTSEMLPWAIEYLLSEGYSFDTLDHFEGEFLFNMQ